MRQFVERWYGEDGVAFDVIFDAEHARFEVVVNESVVFSHATFVEVLRWCMRDEPAASIAASAIDLSPPWEPED